MTNFFQSVLGDELSLNELYRSLHLGFKILDLPMLFLDILQNVVDFIFWIFVFFLAGVKIIGGNNSSKISDHV